MKDSDDNTTQDLFGFDPSLHALRVNDVSFTKTGITATLHAQTECDDIIKLTDEVWIKAISRYLLELCKGDLDVTMREIKKQYVALENELDEARQRQEALARDAQAGFAKIHKFTPAA